MSESTISGIAPQQALMTDARGARPDSLRATAPTTLDRLLEIVLRILARDQQDRGNDKAPQPASRARKAVA